MSPGETDQKRGRDSNPPRLILLADFFRGGQSPPFGGLSPPVGGLRPRLL